MKKYMVEDPDDIDNSPNDNDKSEKNDRTDIPKEEESSPSPTPSSSSLTSHSTPSIVTKKYLFLCILRFPFNVFQFEWLIFVRRDSKHEGDDEKETPLPVKSPLSNLNFRKLADSEGSTSSPRRGSISRL